MSGKIWRKEQLLQTDPDTTFMHMEEGHMRNSQLKQGYNIQCGVESEYIVGVDVSSERNEQNTLIPLLNQKEEQLGTKYQDMTADAGYESEENYSHLEEKKIGCYIKPANYERSKTKKFKSNMALRENMPYDAEKDEYICQNGKSFWRNMSAAEKVRPVSLVSAHIMSVKTVKIVCTKATENCKLAVSKRFIEQRVESLKCITRQTGILLRMNRSIQSEGAFGVVKEDYHFHRFLMRNKAVIQTEILLVAMGYNLRKFHAKT